MAEPPAIGAATTAPWRRLDASVLLLLNSSEWTSQEGWAEFSSATEQVVEVEENPVLSMDQVARVAATAAADASSQLRVAGVTLGGAADGAYVEILVNIEGCRGGVCRVSIGVFRDVTSADLRVQIADKLREHLAEHHVT